MKHSSQVVVTALLSAVVIRGAMGGVRAQSDAAPSSQSAPGNNAPVFDEGKPVSIAPEVALPASMRRTLPRGAKTLFCVAARLDNRPVLLHGWSVKDDTNLDILATTATRSQSRKRKSTRRRTLSTVRLKRIELGRIVPMQIVVRVAPLKTGGHGSVIALNWSEEQSAGAFMTVPMLAVVLPDGSGSAAITQDFSTESSAGGNVFYALCTDQNGAFMLLRDESFDARTQNLQRFTWNNRKFEPQGESVTKPLENSN